MLGLIISILVVGIIAGAVARLVVPGKQNMWIGMTIVLGVVGSFVGGFLGFLIFGADAQDGLPPARRHHRIDHRRDHRAHHLDPGARPRSCPPLVVSCSTRNARQNSKF